MLIEMKDNIDVDSFHIDEVSIEINGYGGAYLISDENVYNKQVCHISFKDEEEMVTFLTVLKMGLDSSKEKIKETKVYKENDIEYIKNKIREIWSKYD